MKSEHHFGFKKIREEDKTKQVQALFSDVASYYDLMNDALSLGTHRLWKNTLIHQIISPTPDDVILDLACGTGDLSFKIRQACPEAKVTMCDLNLEMLIEAKKRSFDENHPNINMLQANAESLPFADCTFNKAMIAFGIRNVTHINLALKELYRVTQNFGTVYIMEFSLPENPVINSLATGYLNHALPLIGRYLVNDESSYKYLGESIQTFPKPEKFKDMLLDAMFTHVDIETLMLGAVRIYKAYKTVD